MISLVMDLCSPCASSFVLVVARKKSECRGKEREIGKKGGGGGGGNASAIMNQVTSKKKPDTNREMQGGGEICFQKNLFLIKN